MSFRGSYRDNFYNKKYLNGLPKGGNYKVTHHLDDSGYGRLSRKTRVKSNKLNSQTTRSTNTEPTPNASFVTQLFQKMTYAHCCLRLLTEGALKAQIQKRIMHDVSEKKYISGSLLNREESASVVTRKQY